MKKILKVFAKIVIALLLALCLCLSVNDNPSHADAGYHSDYSGGSSSSSSSSYSGSSYSSRSSSSSSSSGSSSSGSTSLGGLVFWIIIIIIIVIISNRNKGKPTNTKLQSNATAIAQIKQLLPDFDETKFLQEGYKIFLDVEDAWMNFDLEKVHNIITDELFNMYESQISSMEIKGEQNIMKDFVLKDSAITGFTKQNDNIEVSAKYIIEFYDYIIDKESGNVLRGSKVNKLRMHYDFTFIMSSKQEKIDTCPNCGAPVEVNSSGVCPYCNSKIVGENTSWVMSKKVCTKQTNV